MKKRGKSLKRGGMKGKKKRRKKKGKKKIEYLQYINEIPIYEDPDIVSPTIEIILTLADNICPEIYGNQSKVSIFKKISKLKKLKKIFILKKFYIELIHEIERKIKMKTNKKAKELLLIIQEIHQGAIRDIKMCREKMSEEDYIDIDKTLAENGYKEPAKEPYRIIYDYEPISCPLLDF